LSLSEIGCTLWIVQRYAVVIPFPARHRRPQARAVTMFHPWVEAAALERAQRRFFWACATAAALMTLALSAIAG
jgi:hypothetical protein